MSGQRFRYIHYPNGDEELCDVQNDPYEWKNLAIDPTHVGILERMCGSAPTESHPKKPLNNQERTNDI